MTITLEEKRYEEAMQDYFARVPQKLKPEAGGYPSREDLHDREARPGIESQ